MTAAGRHMHDPVLRVVMVGKEEAVLANGELWGFFIIIILGAFFKNMF